MASSVSTSSKDLTGTARTLTDVLHRIVRGLPNLSAVDDEKALHMAVLMRSLAIVIAPRPNHSQSELLLPSLMAVTDIFLHRTKGDTEKCIALSNIVKIVRYIHTRASDNDRYKMFKLLTSILQNSAQSDICNEAACGMVNFAKNSFSSGFEKSREFMKQGIELTSSEILSNLSTTALAGQHTFRSIVALLHLANRSDWVCTKMIKRRCVVMAVVKQQCSTEKAIRGQALGISWQLLDCPECIKLLEGGQFDENHRILTDGLVQRVHQETASKLRYIVMDQLRKIAVLNRDLDVGIPMLQLFRSFVVEFDFEQVDKDSKNAAVLSAVGYCRLSRLLQFPMEECVVVLSNFLAFPSGCMRLEALKSLEAWVKERSRNLEDYSDSQLLVNLGRVLSEEKSLARVQIIVLRIIKHLAVIECNHHAIRDTLLDPIINLVAKGKHSANGGYKAGVQVLTMLLSTTKNSQNSPFCLGSCSSNGCKVSV